MRGHAALAGAVAVALGLGVAELLAGLIDAAPSLVGAVGQQVIERAPPALATGAIAVLGEANKPVLELGTVVLALVVGAGCGLLARRRPGAAATVVVVFAALGAAAATQEPGAGLPALLVVGALAVATVLLAGWRLLARAGGAPPRAAPAPTRPEISRRAFVRLAAGLGATAVVAGAAGRLALASGVRRVDPAELVLPAPARALAAPTAAQRLDVDGLSPVLTPTDRFFRIDTALSPPRVDPDTWRLRIHGLVEREVVLDYDELLGERLEEFDVTLSCVSNEVGGDLVGTARWLGVRLETLLERAGVRADAEQVVGRAVDGWTGGFPVEAARDGRDAIVAVGMNGEPLPVRHGFPARLVVPGLFGYVSATKWLSEIELAPWDGVDGYWVPRGWAKRAPIKTQSRIDVPRAGDAPSPGEVVAAGVAWAPVRGVARVEVDVDGDERWQRAELSEPLSEGTWVQWRTTVELAPGPHVLRVRAVDGDGEVQPRGPRPVQPDGAEGWHAVRVEVAAP